jgi:hypothetical protein
VAASRTQTNIGDLYLQLSQSPSSGRKSPYNILRQQQEMLDES